MISRPLDNQFGIWAFGDVWIPYLQYQCDPIDLLKSWNNLHGNSYTFKSLDQMYSKLPALVKIWLNTREYHGQEDASNYQENENTMGLLQAMEIGGERS